MKPLPLEIWRAKVREGAFRRLGEILRAAKQAGITELDAIRGVFGSERWRRIMRKGAMHRDVGLFRSYLREREYGDVK